MDDCLLDTSWNLHRIVTNTPSYQDFFSHISTPAYLSPYIDRLTRYLDTHTPQYVDDFDDEREKLGVLKGCKWSIFTTPDLVSANATSITTNGSRIPSATISQRHFSIQIIYQNQLHRYILYSPHLLLSKSPQPHTRKLIDFLSDTFNGLLIDTLKLPPSILSQAIAGSISTIATIIPSSNFTTNNSNQNRSTTNQEPQDNQQLTRLTLLSHLKPALGTLKITISFSAPVAPKLRTIDVDVPYETIRTLITRDPPSSPNPTANDNSNGDNTSVGDKFLISLHRHIHQKTGLKLPLTATSNPPQEPDATLNAQSDEQTTSISTATAPPFHISKITTASLALSIEGKIKFSVRCGGRGDRDDDDNDGDRIGDVIRRANAGVLRLVEGEARRGASEE